MAALGWLADVLPGRSRKPEIEWRLPPKAVVHRSGKQRFLGAANGQERTQEPAPRGRGFVGLLLI